MHRFHSIKSRIVLSFFIFLVPFMILLNYNSLYAIRVMEDETIHQATLTSAYYIQEIDDNLDAIKSYFGRFNINNKDIIQLSAADSTKRFYAKHNLYTKLSSDILFFNKIDYLCLYSVPMDDYIDVSVSRLSYDQTEALKSHMLDGPGPNTYFWQLRRLGGDLFLTYTYDTGSYILGAFISVDNLLNTGARTITGENNGRLIITDNSLTELSDSSFMDSHSIKLDTGSDTWYLSGSNASQSHDAYIVFLQQSKASDIYVWNIIEKNEITKDLRIQRNWINILCLLSILALPLYGLFLNRSIIRPLNIIKNAILRIQGGDMSTQITDDFKVAEYVEIREAFNDMTGEIRNLRTKISNDTIKYQQQELKYQQQELKYQQTELDYLRMQIRPHFFLNALTTIANFATLNKLSEMNMFIDYLSRHIRFMFRSNLSTVTLKDELDHVENYLNLQNLRFNGSIFYAVECPESLEYIQVPAFIVYTFAENIIKHIATCDSFTDVYIRAATVAGETADILELVIEDNGSGFSEDLIRQYNEPEGLAPEDGYHIGIFNMKRVLELLYGHAAHIYFGNSSIGGAQVRIHLPTTPVLPPKTDRKDNDIDESADH